jgi:hypothetical protein
MGENDISITTSQSITEYTPTEGEKRLLDVLLNPEYRTKSITDICKIAACSRFLYYDSFKKPGFQELYKAQSKALVDQSIAPVLNTFVREALRGSFQHGKVILEMAGLYSEKSQLEITGEINVLSPEERKARLIDMLSKKQIADAIDMDPVDE